MSIPTYDYRQPPPADYVDPEGRVNNTGHAEVLIYSDSGADVYCVEIARDRWDKHYRWWSPIPPTPPNPNPRRYVIKKLPTQYGGSEYGIYDTHDGNTVVWIINNSTLAQFIADAMEGRKA